MTSHDMFNNFHISSYYLFGSGFSDDAINKIFCEQSRLQRWLDVEIALAYSQAELGIIPFESARDLEKTGKIANFNIENIKKDCDKTGHSLVPLLTEWKKHIPNKSKNHVHFGTTTQDIQDTAQVLEIKEGAAIIENDLCNVCDALCQLINKHKKTIITGRTHGQSALPTTLSLKFSVYLDQCVRALLSLRKSGSEALVSQLFGGVGTMASFGDNGLELIKLFSQRLNLSVPDVAWHVSRDRVANFIFSLSLICGALANIANEIISLSKNEISELKERHSEYAVGSSTMPHKHNPENSERVVLLYKLTKNCVNLGLDSLCNEHERDYRSVRLEWVSLYEAMTYTAKSLKISYDTLTSIKVNKKNIINNMMHNDSIFTEKLVFAMEPLLGKDCIYQILFNIYNKNDNEDEICLVDELMNNHKICEKFTREDINNFISSSNYVGFSDVLSEKVVSNAKSLTINRELSYVL